MIRVMVRSFNGWRLWDGAHHAREVWSTWSTYDSAREAEKDATNLRLGGAATATLLGDTEYERFCSSHVIA